MKSESRKVKAEERRRKNLDKIRYEDKTRKKRRNEKKMQVKKYKAKQTKAEKKKRFTWKKFTKGKRDEKNHELKKYINHMKKRFRLCFFLAIEEKQLLDCLTHRWENDGIRPKKINTATGVRTRLLRGCNPVL